MRNEMVEKYSVWIYMKYGNSQSSFHWNRLKIFGNFNLFNFLGFLWIFFWKYKTCRKLILKFFPLLLKLNATKLLNYSLYNYHKNHHVPSSCILNGQKNKQWERLSTYIESDFIRFDWWSFLATRGDAIRHYNVEKQFMVCVIQATLINTVLGFFSLLFLFSIEHKILL